MRRKVTLKEVISVVKLSLFLGWCWPQPRDATQFKMLCVKLHHYLNIIIEISIIAPLIYGITKHLDEPGILAPLIVFISTLTHVSFNFIFYMVNHHHIRNVTFEMVHFSDLMNPHEEVLIQRYIDKCVVFHGVSMFIFYFFPFLTIAIPFFSTQQSFPIFDEYPFDISYQPLKTIIYIQQSVAGILLAVQLCTNIFMALLLWFASARFEILSEELGKVTNIYQLYKCIKKHQELLEYATEVTLVARPFVFTTVCCSTVCVIATFLLLVTNQPIPKLLQFSGLFLCLFEVFMYTWSAEYLMFMCHNVAQAAFNILENNNLINLIEIWKCLQIIVMRSQKPVKISIPCFVPTLSLNYFTSYLSTVFSYFTTLRVIMDNDDN